MKIGIISDAHRVEADEGLRRVAAEVFKDVSLR